MNLVNDGADSEPTGNGEGPLAIGRTENVRRSCLGLPIPFPFRLPYLWLLQTLDPFPSLGNSSNNPHVKACDSGTTDKTVLKHVYNELGLSPRSYNLAQSPQPKCNPVFMAQPHPKNPKSSLDFLTHANLHPEASLVTRIQSSIVSVVPKPNWV